MSSDRQSDSANDRTAQTEQPGMRTRWVMILALWIPLTFTLVLAFLAHQGQISHDLDSRWLLHTAEVRNQLGRLNSLVKDVESSGRGYLLTGNSSFLAPYDEALKEIPGQGRRLAELVADNPAQIAAATRLEVLIAEKLSLAAQSVSLAQHNKLFDAVEIVRNSRGRQLMDAIRLQVAAMGAEEDRLFAVRQKTLTSQGETQTSIMTGLVLVDVALIAGASLLIRRTQKLQQTAEARTDQANTRTDQANTRTEQAEIRTQETMAASELIYRRLFETAQEGILILDAETGQVVDANPFMKELLGYSQNEFLGKKLWEIGPFKGVVASKITFAELQLKDRIRHESLPLETKDGRRVQVEFTSNAYQVREKRFIQCNIRDVTEARKNEARFRRLVDSNVQGVMFWNAKGEITGANDAFLGIVGHRREDLEAGRLGLAAMTPPEYTEVDGRNLKEMAARGMAAPAEKEFIRKDGSRVPVLVGAAAFEDNPDEGVGFVLDLTGRKKLEEQFRQSQKMEGIGQLAGGVAHDFNNILAVIQMQSDLLVSSGGNLTAAQLGFAEEIGAAAQRAAALTRQLLLFSRKETMQARDLELNQSINDMTKMLRRVLGENIQMQFKFSMQSLFLRADAGMIDQVLMNLAVNSRDAMPKGGQLIIESSAVECDEMMALQAPGSRPGSFVCLSVSDTGCGIPPENLPRIFEPFFTTKEVGKGTGLGLATVFGIVQQHQGWINVYSEAGHGTTFRIYLPRLPRLTQQTLGPAESATMRGGHETILLVEDDAFLHASIHDTLIKLGYRVLAAASGIKATAVWKEHHDEINLLLTDLVMPGGITGIELGQSLLQEDPKLKVVYMSGYSSEMAGRNLSLKTAANFLNKPFRALKLAQTIRDCLDATST